MIFSQHQASVKRGNRHFSQRRSHAERERLSERVYEPESEAMFATQIETAIDAACGCRVLDDLSRLIWRGLSAGVIGDDEAQRLAERIHTRRMLNNATSVAGEPQRLPAGSTGRPSIFGPPRRPQRPPSRSQAIGRRRRIAASGAMPPAIAARFTVAEQAVLSVVASEVKHKDRCSLCLDALAARAGCCRTSAKNALRAAARLGFITVIHRPRRGQKNLPNVIEIVSADWQTWLKRGPSRPTGHRGQMSAPHEYKNKKAFEKRRDFTGCEQPKMFVYDSR